MEMREKAKIIINQLGGVGKLSAMVGADKFIYDDKKNLVSFKFKGSKKINWVTIIINGLDLYDVEFTKVTQNRKTFDTKFDRVAEFNDVYAEDLKSLFETTTGLYLSL